MSRHSTETHFGLLRHARTVWNREKRLQGQQDSPLLPESEQQAQSWGKVLEAGTWDRILASDLGRTLHTAALINKTLRVPIAEDPRLREKDWGIWTGRTVTRIREATPEALAELESAGWGFCPPGGEERIRVWERSREALEAASRKWPGQNILVVTHEGVIKCLIYRLLGRRFLPSEPKVLVPGYLHELIVTGDRLLLCKLNALQLNWEIS
ncbi:histidine phosphatase family protein [Desulfonema ishimotonii]|uniref:Histidine phosphatase family protein n=1 Tax=Desulfonema ishimotonii TaxID=45657 RepID=A0A401G1V9_9BACT|nr:histidine phosphatase family protein [Desulfonema ishimotonii]GBC63209.1 histidine phosphatase family protein [Desulfonema ishimotonii]